MRSNLIDEHLNLVSSAKAEEGWVQKCEVVSYFVSEVRKQREDRKGEQFINSQVLPPNNQPSVASQGSTSFQNRATSWGPGAQTHKPMGDVSYLNHNRFFTLGHWDFVDGTSIPQELRKNLENKTKKSQDHFWRSPKDKDYG